METKNMDWLNKIGFVNLNYIKNNNCISFFENLANRHKKSIKTYYIPRSGISRWYDLIAVINYKEEKINILPTPMFLIAMGYEKDIDIDKIPWEEEWDIKHNYSYTMEEWNCFKQFFTNSIIEEELEEIKNNFNKKRNIEIFNKNKNLIEKYSAKDNNHFFFKIISTDYDEEKGIGDTKTFVFNTADGSCIKYESYLDTITTNNGILYEDEDGNEYYEDEEEVIERDKIAKAITLKDYISDLKYYQKYNEYYKLA